MNIKTAKKKIEEAIRKKTVLELFYRTDDGIEMYFAVAPVCIKEHDGKQYLMTLGRLDKAFAFDIARITSMGEYWATFSLDKNFNMEKFLVKVFSEGKYTDGYIVCAGNEDLDPEALRNELRKIETDIKALAGNTKDDYIDLPENLDRNKMEELLSSRSHCLDMLFRKDPDGIRHFIKINGFLKDLTDRMYRRGAKIYRQYLTAGIDDGFDDDFMIDADLRYYYNGKDAVAILGNEEYYGSDFDYMLNVICEFCHESPVCGASFSKSLCKTDRPEMSDKELDFYNRADDFDWGELKIWIPELEGIKICHAVGEICVYHTNGYSVPDLLRMNNFSCEVKATYQHVPDQNGNRRNFREDE